MPQPRFGRSSFVNDYFPPGIKWLLIVNVGIFILQSLGLDSTLKTFFALYPEATFGHFWIWQVFTYMFLHGGTLHLLFNMLSLWMFGTQLERDMGTRRFLKYYFYCGTAAGICVLAVNLALHESALTIGASGAIFGVLVAFGVMYPNQT